MEPIFFPLYLSLKIAFIATILSFILGIIFAWIFTFKKNAWTELLSLLVTLPLILPPTVLGYYLLIAIGNNSTLGRLIESLTGGQLIFTWKAAVIAATIASLPLLIRPIQVAFESIEADILNSARLDGATNWDLLRAVILPLSYKGVLAGVVLGFARAMGEFGATLMVAGNIPGKTQTLSIAIYDAVQANRMMDAHTMVLILSIATITILFIVHRWLNKG
ncbi:molybdate ABC transporter permease subunit [Cytobacillus sp. S13-E01]|uniref:molybdate ABC transporter permease subunit n=1 Tax=Cytobacillus sp. S13-E01 TaxID=3031326 RepID=UPI0023D8B967|nr:molybdate ABC transporter permease subunit [Cytobacillus sp. S13-E01]MDF0727292.1 molybdate ABC transporter permease subunit [Cytobacillus sp. S13-E01]